MLLITRGKHTLTTIVTSSVRSGTVPTIVPSAYTLPPSCSVNSTAVPPTNAAESKRNSVDFHAEPAPRNSGSDSSRKHGILQYGSRSTGNRNSEQNAYTAPNRDTASVGNILIRTPIHAAASRYTQQFIRRLSARNGSTASLMRRGSPSRSCRPIRRSLLQAAKDVLPGRGRFPSGFGSPAPSPPEAHPARRPNRARDDRPF